MSSIQKKQIPDKSLGKLLRYQFARILGKYPDSFSVEDASKALKMDRDNASKILSRLAEQGWLMRVGRGVYIPIRVEFDPNQYTIENPLIVADKLFAPCYIGGFTALSYWDLTEQIFLTTTVMTTKQVRQREVEVKGTKYQIYTINPRKMFGTKNIWESYTKLQVSDPSRTMIDIFDTPIIGGGIRQVEEFYQNYLRSEYKDTEKLIEYAKQFGNGAVFKRLGFLTELIAPEETQLIDACKENMTTGNAKLDPSLSSDNLIKKWNLWVPSNWKIEYKKDDNKARDSKLGQE